MKKIILVLFPIFIFGQTEIINPKEKWYFGAALGLNTIKSISFGKPEKSIQSGVLAEYSIARHWSLSGGIKYLEIDVSFSTQNTHSGSFFDLGSDASYVSYKVIPTDIKWEFRLHNNLAESLKLGLPYYIETNSKYSKYYPNNS